MLPTLVAVLAFVLGAERPRPAGEVEDPLAAAVLSASEVTDGLCVHVGVGDGRLTAALSRAGQVKVYGLALKEQDWRNLDQFIQTAKLSQTENVRVRAAATDGLAVRGQQRESGCG